MTWRQIPFIVIFAFASTQNINYCSEAISYLQGYTCKYEEPESYSKVSYKTFLIQNEKKEVNTLKVKPASPFAKKEIDILRKFKENPQIVNLLDYKITEKYVFLILDSGDKMTLQTLTHNLSILSDNQIYFKIARQILQMLIWFQQQKISLLAIHPSSIELSSDNIPIFTNLSHASFYSDHQPFSAEIELLAPELVDKLISHRAVSVNGSNDAYSFGILLYYMKYKHLPFSSNISSSGNLLSQTVEFPAGENLGFIDLVKSCLIVEPKRVGLKELDDMIIELNLRKNKDLVHQQTKYQLRDGRLIYFENENEKQKLIVIGVGGFVFAAFVIGFVYIKCKKCFPKKKLECEESFESSSQF